MIKDKIQKNVVSKDKISVIYVIEKVRKEIKLCDEVANNSGKMKEQIKEMEEREQYKTKEKRKKIYER